MHKRLRRDAYWAVTVNRNGEDIVTLASHHMGGKSELSEADEDAIVNAARHLLSFVGADARKRCGCVETI
jgi:hypothetical protein